MSSGQRHQRTASKSDSATGAKESGFRTRQALGTVVANPNNRVDGAVANLMQNGTQLNASRLPTGQSSAGSLEENLRQLAVLQALVTRQQALVRSAAQANGHAQIVLPEVEPASSHIYNEYPGLDIARPASNTAGEDPARGQTSAVPVATTDSPNWLTGGSAEEFAQAQQQLNSWSQTVFRTNDSPIYSSGQQTMLSTPLPTPLSPSSSGFDWSHLYSLAPETVPLDVTDTLSTTFGLAQVPSNDGTGPSSATSTLAAVRPGLTQSTSYETGINSSELSSKSLIRPRRASRAASVSSNSYATSTADSSPKQGVKSDLHIIRDPSVPADQLFDSLNELRPPPLKSGTVEEIEEDKRMRNTLASARFRAKKKLKDQQLLQSSLSLREKVAELEQEKASLAAENQWLKALVSDSRSGKTLTQRKKR
ncbi:hypothetical protein OIV83_005171 [Microbotryomycetes sp. JL201]|nr:hypothetical protein OIV83_005171 [Microbotryomycetes sp. JL201]